MINDGQILKTAELARLEITPNELQKYTKDVGEILQYVDQLNQVNTDGVVPMTHGVDGGMRMRADEVKSFETDADGKPKILKCAPEVLNDGFKVPQII